MKNKNSVIIFIAISLMIFIASCVTVRVVDIPKPSSDGVEIYLTDIPDKDFKEIKYIQVDGAIFHTPEKMMVNLADRAKTEGADAVINVKFDYQAWYPVLSGVAIKYQ